MITKQLSRVISRTPSTRSQKRSRDGGEEATPYDVENPPPVPTMSLQSRAEENYRGHPEMEAIDTFKGMSVSSWSYEEPFAHALAEILEICHHQEIHPR